jgi:hypothetical protein
MLKCVTAHGCHPEVEPQLTGPDHGQHANRQTACHICMLQCPSMQWNSRSAAPAIVCCAYHGIITITSTNSTCSVQMPVSDNNSSIRQSLKPFGQLQHRVQTAPANTNTVDVSARVHPPIAELTHEADNCWCHSSSSLSSQTHKHAQQQLHTCKPAHTCDSTSSHSMQTSKVRHVHAGWPPVQHVAVQAPLAR